MSNPRIVVLFTDFGVMGPYVGQMKAAMLVAAPDILMIDLFADAPRFSPVAAGHLLAPYVIDFPAGTVFLCVVDPGVGTALRRPVVATVDDRYFVGPDNGLFDVVASRALVAKKCEILWRPSRLSASFHGRDLFAPVAAKIAANTLPQAWLGEAEPFPPKNAADQLSQVIYIDGYGNAMTGLLAVKVGLGRRLKVKGHEIVWARTFGDVPQGTPFWYENGNGLAELAVNCGNAAEQLSIGLGDKITIV